ncbi:hypothetical protein SDC9_144085 [bioreactor metagenome]|uniref:Peptidase family U32 C-terminal domain-containing protein n=1 Tax=bioreactor metagenome TaxID=1076179 RepID=A0A645E5V7_9ZZZZ
MADLGVFALCRRLLPETDIHISTQGAVVNSESCRIWHEMGAKRIVLARELTLDEIKRIRDNVPETLELEVFIHGAMCVSISGRCLLSEYYVDRDANRGKCAQPCRWIYNFAEEKRPDDILTGEVHREGTYLFGSKDMNLIRHIDELCDSGIDCFKIEGRMKSAYYAAVTANAYHIAIDAHNSSQPADIDALALELDGVSHREYCTGYFFDHPYLNSQLADKPGYIRESSFLATIDRFDPETHTAFCTQKNKMYSGFPAELLTPGKTGVRFIAGEMRDSEGCIIDASPHPQMKYSVRFPDDFPFTPKTGDIIRAAQC